MRRRPLPTGARKQQQAPPAPWRAWFPGCPCCCCCGGTGGGSCSSRVPRSGLALPSAPRQPPSPTLGAGPRCTGRAGAAKVLCSAPHALARPHCTWPRPPGQPRPEAGRRRRATPLQGPRCPWLLNPAVAAAAATNRTPRGSWPWHIPSAGG